MTLAIGEAYARMVTVYSVKTKYLKITAYNGLDWGPLTYVSPHQIVKDIETGVVYYAEPAKNAMRLALKQ